MRLAAIEMIDEAKAGGFLEDPLPDAIFTTSLLSVCDLRAALPRGARDIPIVLYMHENQAEYPRNDDAAGRADWDAQYALTNLTGLLTADAVIWNSRWNRASFKTGIETLLGHAPDTTLTDMATRLGDGHVIWPPVETTTPDDRADAGVLHNTVRVVWPHRWEHDKGPERLLDLAVRHSEELNLRWVILGEQYAKVPGALLEFQSQLADRIDHFGYAADRDEYRRLLGSADWVLSTARHEFFGIAVVEALFAGCLPWLPAELSYPELLPNVAHGLSPMNRPDDQAAIRRAIQTHLAPARAPDAVRRIDDVMTSMK